MFPRLVFRSPGPHQCQGGTYAYASVADQEQFGAHVADGWHATLPEALVPPTPKGITPLDEPPTRDELKRKAVELGLTHAPNIPSAKLAEMIDAALTPKV